MKKSFRVIAAILTLTMLIQIFSVTAAAKTDNAEISDISSESAAENLPPEALQEEVEEPEIICEATDRRDEYTKHFLREDGSFIAVSYSGKVHYRNSEKDAWKEIDNTLNIKSEKKNGLNVNCYSPKASPVDVSFPADITKDSGVSYTIGSNKISWNYVIPQSNSITMDSAAAVDAPVTAQLQKIENTEAESDITAPKNLESSLVYPNYYKDVDIKYTVNPDGIKEDLILKSNTAQKAFYIAYKTGNLTAQKKDDNTILFLDGENAVAELAAPYMYDSNNEMSDKVKLDIVSQTEGVLLVSLTADEEWLNSENRAYPVVIDPYIMEKNTDIANDVTARYAGGANTCPAGSLVVGRNTDYKQCRSFIKFTLPTLGSGDMVTGGFLKLPQFGGSYGYSTSDPMQINISNVLSAWDENSLAKTQGFSGLPSCSSEILDYITTSHSSSFVWREFNVSKSVKDWYNGAIVNNGWYLWSNSESTTAATIFASANYDSQTYKPTLIITYLNNKGLEDRWTYHSQSLGNSGASYINDYTGNLVFAAPVTGTTGNICPASVSLVYNGYQVGSYAVGQGKSGLGWRFDFNQKINSIVNGANELSTKLYAAGYRYIYSDSDGTEHYFTQIGTSNKYEDEEGMGLTIEVLASVNSAYEKYIMTYESGEKISFQSSGAIRRIYNTDGKYSEYSYGSTNLNKITDGAGRNILFEFDSNNRVTKVTDPASRATTFTYDGSGYLTQITYPDGSKTSFGYTSGKLSKVTARDGYVLQYSYSTKAGVDASTASRVTGISEKGRDGTAGKSLQIDYAFNNQTTFKDSDGLTETYQFDNVGRTICAVGPDGAASTYSYSSANLKDKTANKLLSASNTLKHVDNMLIDHSFENGSGKWTIYGDVLGTIVSENPYLGSKALKMSQTGSAAMTAYQRMSFAPGTYTLSAYVKTNSATTGAYMYANCLNNSTSVGSYSSQTVSEVTDGYKRISVTFTAPANTNYVNIALVTKGAGTAWFDCVQLESGNCVNDYNLLENSSFENAASGIWKGSGLSSTDGLGSFSNGKKYYQITGASTTTPNLRQTVQINRPAKDTFFSVSGNARASSVTIRDNRYYAMDIKTNFSDGAVAYNIIPFNPDVTGWQYKSEVIGYTGANASKTISSIEFLFIYYQNPSKAYFDSFSLNIDKTGTTYTYDDKGNLISSKDNAGRNQTYTYNSAKEVQSVTTADNKNYTYKYDTKNPHRLLTATSKSSNLCFAFDYDSNGNVTKSKIMAVNSDGSQNTSQKIIQTETTYTSNGNYAATQKDAAGKVTSYSYDQTKGNLNSVTDPKGNKTSYTYNANNDKLTSVTAGGTSVNYSYQSGTGYLSGIDGATSDYSFSYDSFGKTTGTKVGAQNLMTNTYEADNGNLLKSTYGNGDTVGYVYDYYGRLAQKKYNDSVKFLWYYNSKGDIGRFLDNVNGKTYTYNYDLVGRIESVNVSDGSYIRNSYNNIDLTTGLEYKYGGKTKKVGYSYSSKDNLPEKVTLPNKTEVKNAYDKLGRVSSVDYGGIFTCDYTYTDVDDTRTTGLVSTMRTLKDMPMYTYTYDDNGNIATSGFANYDGTNNVPNTFYTYDSLNQLIRSDSNYSGATWVYTYDKGGNITRKTRYPANRVDDLSIVPVYETIDYTYGNSNWGDLLTAYNGKAITYDEIGNPLTYDGNTYTWQNGRQLASINTGTDNLSFKYNYDGIRTQKTVNGVTTEFFLNGSQIIAQKTGNDIMWFYYDNDGKRIALEYQGKMYYYAYNVQGDVTFISDEYGNVAGGYNYDDWGNITSYFNAGPDNTVADANPFRYRGYYYDNETGLYYLNSRYYNPEWGRFINADNAISGSGKSVQGYNLFAYCNNDPINLIDITGHWPQWVKKVANKISKYLGGQVRAAVSTDLEYSETNYILFKIKTGKKEIISTSNGESKPVTAYVDVTNMKTGLEVKSDNLVVGHGMSLASSEIYNKVSLDNTTYSLKESKSLLKRSYTLSSSLREDNMATESYMTIEFDKPTMAVAAVLCVSVGPEIATIVTGLLSSGSYQSVPIY